MTDSSTSIDFSLSLVYHSWLDFRRGKIPSKSIIEFEYDLERNLFELWQELAAGRYKHGPYIHKVINEKKRRDIHVAAVRDRIVHRLVYDYLMPKVNECFDFDVWSCRPGKGLHACVRRVENLSRRHRGAYVWRGDVRKFFDSVGHDKLLEILGRYDLPGKIIRLLREIVWSFRTSDGKGLAIGNLTSQILANIYLNEFDVFVRHTLKPLAYVRYGDDMILWTNDRETAERTRSRSAEFLHDKLGLELNCRNEFIGQSRHGLKFIGARIFHTGSAVDNSTWRRVESSVAVENFSGYTGLLWHIGSNRQRDELAFLLTK